MNIKKGDSLIRLIERACHKQTLPRGMPNPKKNGCAKNPREGGYALKELKEVGWSKQTLGKGMK